MDFLTDLDSVRATSELGSGATTALEIGSVRGREPVLAAAELGGLAAGAAFELRPLRDGEAVRAAAEVVGLAGAAFHVWASS